MAPSTIDPNAQARAFQANQPNSYTYDFRTPADLLWYVHENVMPITHDGACSEENFLAAPLRLEDDWAALPSSAGIFINPPWDMASIILWCEKVADIQARAVFLLPVKLTDTRLQKSGVMEVFDHLEFLGGRIDFSGPASGFRRAGTASRWGTFLAHVRCDKGSGFSWKLLREIKADWRSNGSPEWPRASPR